MKGSTGASMGGSIEYTRQKKKKSNGNTCKKCIHFRNGKCVKFGFYPSTIELAKKCKEFAFKARNHHSKPKTAEEKEEAKKKKQTRPKKKCNTCSHFIYAYNGLTGKMSYKCEITGKYATSYTQTRNCDVFNKKES